MLNSTIPAARVLSLAIDAIAPPPAADSLGALAELAQSAESAGFDLILTGYGAVPSPRLDALTLAAALITRTRDIGLCALVTTDSWAPFNVARAFASFDLLAHGRAGWFAAPGPAGDDPSFARFAEHLEVVFALFDSWGPDALVFDKPAAVFADRNQVRRIGHHGRHFTVDGPLNAPRPVQGRPVILQSAAVDAPATASADIAVSCARSLDQAQAERAQVRAPLMIVDLAVSLADAPLASERLAWRGPAQALTDLMEAWLLSGCVDGFNIMPADPAADLQVLTDEVLPELRRRGLLARPTAGGDLRTRLGLAHPRRRPSTPLAPPLS
jgi:alkanesulfonate monooxygenase SsuD/methylene tetrahydromethanopterin reductase-like flavin-dependent oxidoreductase (luciferase family)